MSLNTKETFGTAFHCNNNNFYFFTHIYMSCTHTRFHRHTLVQEAQTAVMYTSQNSMQHPSGGLLPVYPIVVGISIRILHDDGIADQIITGSVKSEEEQREADREQKRQHEVFHHRSTECQRQTQIGPGGHQDHVWLVWTFHGSYASTLDHSQAHHVLARCGTSDETVNTMLKPKGLKAINNYKDKF